MLRHAIRHFSRWLTLHAYIMRRLDRIVTSLMAVTEALLDAAVTRFGCAYIVAAAVLISLVAAVYFAAVVPEVGPANGRTAMSYIAACVSCKTHATTARCMTAALRLVVLCLVLHPVWC